MINFALIEQAADIYSLTTQGFLTASLICTSAFSFSLCSFV